MVEQSSLIRVGKSGLRLPPISLGTALTVGVEIRKPRTVHKFIRSALGLGLCAFDTANNYGAGSSEQVLGRALRGVPRTDYVLSTKGSWPLGSSPLSKGLSRDHLTHALRDSRKRLRQPSIDLYYAHRLDPEVPVGEIVRTFNHFIDQGAISYWGVSEWPYESLVEAVDVANRLGLEPPVANQVSFSYLIDDALTSQLISRARQIGVTVVGYAPLAQGLLSGKYENEIPGHSRIAKADRLGYFKTEAILRQKEKKLKKFLEFADFSSIPPTMLALRWALRHGIPLVAGATSLKQLSVLSTAVAEGPLNEEVFGELERTRKSCEESPDPS